MCQFYIVFGVCNAMVLNSFAMVFCSLETAFASLVFLVIFSSFSIASLEIVSDFFMIVFSSFDVSPVLTALPQF